jgi:anti-sigma factor RsiW
VKARIVSFDSENHYAVQLILPWYVVGRLDDAERQRVEAHLPDCARCRADVAWQRRLRSAAIQPETVGDVEHGLAALRSRIASEAHEATQAPAAASKTRRMPWRRVRLAWWRWAFALQSAAMLGFALLLFVPRPADDVYHALGSAPAASADLIVVFQPTATEAQIRQALLASDSRLVGGPSSTGAYLLSVAPRQRDRALEQLRHAPGVARVDSLETAR